MDLDMDLFTAVLGFIFLVERRKKRADEKRARDIRATQSGRKTETSKFNLHSFYALWSVCVR